MCAHCPLKPFMKFTFRLYLPWYLILAMDQVSIWLGNSIVGNAWLTLPLFVLHWTHTSCNHENHHLSGLHSPDRSHAIYSLHCPDRSHIRTLQSLSVNLSARNTKAQKAQPFLQQVFPRRSSPHPHPINGKETTCNNLQMWIIAWRIVLSCSSSDTSTEFHWVSLPSPLLGFYRAPSKNGLDMSNHENCLCTVHHSLSMSRLTNCILLVLF